MKILRKGILILMATAFVSASYAGNEDRAGEAGASELLINPWARSSGMGSSNSASITGLEATSLNVAGMAHIRKTEVMFTHSKWLVGSGIDINSFGFSQKVGESGSLGMSVMAMNFGDIQVTTADLPEGGLGTFSPNYTNIGLSYARRFSNSISGGFTARVISEGISDMSAQGMSFDAGIRYVTGEHDQIKFGLSLRNVGPPMQYNGDGLSFRSTDINTGITSTNERRSEDFELPSLMNIGISYDFYLLPEVDSTGDQITSDHRLTVAGTFTSNSFTRDQYKLGLEYAFKSMFMVRAGYVASEGNFSSDTRTSAFTGPTAGFSVEIPLGESESSFRIDYSYAVTDPFQGSHRIGAVLDL